MYFLFQFIHKSEETESKWCCLLWAPGILAPNLNAQLIPIVDCCCYKSCPTLCDSMDDSPLGSSVHGTPKARILEWVAISFSRGSSCPRDRTWVSCFSQFNRSVVSDSFWSHGLQHTRPPCPSPTPRVYSNSCPLSRWCHPTISSSVVLFSTFCQSGPASESFQMSQFFASGDQSIGISPSASVLLMNIQDWFPLGWTGCISLQSTGLSRVFSNTTVQKHQFFSAQLSL